MVAGFPAAIPQSIVHDLCAASAIKHSLSERINQAADDWYICIYTGILCIYVYIVYIQHIIQYVYYIYIYIQHIIQYWQHCL